MFACQGIFMANRDRVRRRKRRRDGRLDGTLWLAPR